MNKKEKPSVFGRSLQLVNGDLHFTEDAMRDFVIISGRDNFLQAMQVMIETPFGTDVFNVNYGFDLMNSISQPKSVRFIKELIRLNIVKSLSLDNRVREIRDVVFNDDPRFSEIIPGRVDQASKASRRWEAVVVLETVSEGEVALRLEGAGL